MKQLVLTATRQFSMISHGWLSTVLTDCDDRRQLVTSSSRECMPSGDFKSVEQLLPVGCLVVCCVNRCYHELYMIEMMVNILF